LNRIKLFLKNNKHFLYLLFFIPLLLWFYFCEKSIQPKYNMHCSVDNYIPFFKYFIIPYLLWFPYMGFAFVYLGLKDKRSYLKLLAFILSGMSISYIIFIVFPTGQDLRPMIDGNDIFSNLIKMIQGIDPPTNVCPSIHVLNTIGVHTAIVSYKNVPNRIKIVSLLNMVLICASTVFIKQHSILDVAAGLALSAILLLIIFVIPEVFINNKNRISENLKQM
jgi:membrane-associated phospholipid phosphatase